MRVLYVEDDLRDAELTRRELGRHAPEIELDTVTTLHDARSRLAGEPPYDIVLTDLNLPDGSGMELVVNVRERALPIAVVVLTGVDAGETTVAALKAGADDYLVKQGDYLARLPTALTGALERSRVESTRRASPLRVLYAHDGIADPDLVSAHLASHAPHISPDFVHGIPAALERLADSAAKFDVVVLEHRTGALDALGALKSLRSDGSFDLPLVLLAEQQDSAIAAQAFRFGAAEYLAAYPGHLAALPAALESVHARAELAREQAALRESELLYRTLFEQAAVGVAQVDAATGRIVHANQRYAEMLGYTREELEQLDFQTITHPDDLADSLANLERLDAGEIPAYTAEKRYIRKDGSSVWTALSVSPLRGARGGVPAARIAVAVDISERKQIEEALRESEERFRAVFDLSPISVVLTSVPEGEIVAANNAFATSSGYPRHEVVGRTTRELNLWVNAADRDQYLALIDRDGGVRNLETVLRRKDGSHFNALFSSQRITIAGEPFGLTSVSDITNRVRAEEELRNAHDHHEATLEAIPDLLFELDSSGRYVGFHVTQSDLLAVPPDQLLDRHFDQVLPPEAARVLAEALEQAVEQGSSRGHEYELVVPAGRRWFELSVAQMPARGGNEPGFIVLAHDVNDRKQAEVALQESEARLASIVDRALDGIITLDEKQRIVVFNAAAEAMFGRAAAEMIGQPLDRLLPTGLTASHRKHVERYQRSQDTSRRMGGSLRVTGLRADGEEFPLEAAISQTEARGRTLLTVVLRDLTERQRAEDLRARLEAQLADAKRMEAIGTLASGIAHDFNNILAVVLGYTELAQHKLGGDHPVAKHLIGIERASRQGSELVREILTFGRQTREERRVASMRTVIEEAVESASAHLPAQIELDSVFGADIPYALINPTQIYQVVMNLCTNAQHAIGERPGHIEVRVESTIFTPDETDLDLDLKPGPYIHVSVSDTGEGMDAATQERIFEPFFTTKPFGLGTGLGLSVVHGIVKAHGGAITATSRVGEGTTFDLYFPAVEAPDGHREAAPPELGLAPGNGVRIAYVDDDESLVSLKTEALNELGYITSGYTDSAEALEAVRADPLAFGLVITDFNMPGLSGLELARELELVRPALPVVLVSAYVTDELQAEAALCGVRQILSKPTRLQDLVRTVGLLTETAPPVDA